MIERVNKKLGEKNSIECIFYPKYTLVIILMIPCIILYQLRSL